MAKAKHVNSDTPVVVDIDDNGETHLTVFTDDEPVTFVADDPITMETVIVREDVELNREQQQR